MGKKGRRELGKGGGNRQRFRSQPVLPFTALICPMIQQQKANVHVRAIRPTPSVLCFRCADITFPVCAAL